MWRFMSHYIVPWWKIHPLWCGVCLTVTCCVNVTLREHWCGCCNAVLHCERWKCFDVQNDVIVGFFDWFHLFINYYKHCSIFLIPSLTLVNENWCENISLSDTETSFCMNSYSPSSQNTYVRFVMFLTLAQWHKFGTCLWRRMSIHVMWHHGTDRGMIEFCYWSLIVVATVCVICVCGMFSADADIWAVPGYISTHCGLYGKTWVYLYPLWITWW